MSRAPVMKAGLGGPGPGGAPMTDAEGPPARMIYGWDALSGWCFGAIPAMRHVATLLPDLPISLLPGGLYSGAKVRPYSADIDHIRAEVPRMETVTGRTLSGAFWQLVEHGDPVTNSAAPALALLRLQAQSPDNALDFAHQLQEAHFLDGRDLNDPALYDELITRFALPDIPLADLPDATDTTPDVAAAYREARAREIVTYPTLIVEVEGREAGRIESVYDPDILEARIRDLLP